MYIGHPLDRTRVDRFALYLRVLDAGDAGATSSEIAAVLFPNQSKEQGLSYVRDYRDAATKLSNKDYLFIAAGVGKHRQSAAKTQMPRGSRSKSLKK
jgi:T6SS, Transcription factor, DNA binding domain